MKTPTKVITGQRGPRNGRIALSATPAQPAAAATPPEAQPQPAAPAATAPPASATAQPQRRTLSEFFSPEEIKAIRLTSAAIGEPINSLAKRFLAAKRNGGHAVPTSSRQPTAADRDADLIRLENQRVTNLRTLSTLYPGLPKQTVDLAVSSNWDVPKAREEFLKAMAAQNQPQQVRPGEDRSLRTLSQNISEAIMLRAGQKVEKPDERSTRWRHLSIIEIGRLYLQAVGLSGAEEMGRSRVAEMLMNPHVLRRHVALSGQQIMLAESVGDFPAILADTINKSLRVAFLDAPRTWTRFCRRATAPDFKIITRAALSESPSMVSREVGKEINYVALSDTKETYNLGEYIGGIKLTRRALINDDLDAFSRIPLLQANTCARLEDDQAYAVVTTNAALIQDNIALFNSAHGNVTASGSGGAPSVAQLQLGWTAIKTQKGPKAAARLELIPKILLVPTALEAGTKQLIKSEQLIPLNTTSGAASQGASNPFANGFDVIGSTRLNDASATAWYMMADYRDGQIDTIEVCFLEDEPEPVLRQETDFDTEDLKFAVRHTVAAKAIDFRGMYQNAGN